MFSQKLTSGAIESIQSPQSSYFKNDGRNQNAQEFVGGVVAALISVLLCTLNVPSCYLHFHVRPCSSGLCRLHMPVFDCILIYSLIEVKDNRLPAGWGGTDAKAVRNIDAKVIPRVTNLQQYIYTSLIQVCVSCIHKGAARSLFA